MSSAVVAPIRARMATTRHAYGRRKPTSRPVVLLMLMQKGHTFEYSSSGRPHLGQ